MNNSEIRHTYIVVGSSHQYNKFPVFWNDYTADHSKRFNRLKDDTMKEIGEYDQTEPCAYLSSAEVQELMDSLFSAGVRPSAAKGSSEAMSKINDHLQDMRDIAFSKMGVERSK